MTLRFVCADDDGTTCAVLAAVADQAGAAGLLLAGTTNPPAAARPGRIIITLLPTATTQDVTLDLGRGGSGCKLDVAVLDSLVQQVQRDLPRAQALIVNKFGKQEATGRGLVPAISDAVADGLPILVGVPPAGRAAFLAFAGPAARELTADVPAVVEWLCNACAAATEAQGDLT